jgi:hypothetical protein
MSLLEVAVALLLVAVTLAGLAPVLLRCTAMLLDARSETRAVALARSRLEQAAALTCVQDAATLLVETDLSSNLARVPPDATGTGLLSGDPSSAWVDTPGFVDWRTLDDRPLAAPDPGRAAFVRRWGITALPAPAGTDRLLIQVFARDRAREAREGPRVSAQPRPGDVWLFTIRARVLR